MGKRGPKPKGKVKLEWSKNFAYAIGLFVADGCVAKNLRHITFSSKDREQISNFQKAIGIKVNEGKYYSGNKDIYAFRVQWSDVPFAEFLYTIGIIPNKSKIIQKVDIPKNLFFEFLRGLFDGDGSVYSYKDKRWKNSFMFYISFASASLAFLLWLQGCLNHTIGVKGHITTVKGRATAQLKFAKKESYKIIKKMYNNKAVICLSRKKLKIDKILSIVGKEV